MKRVLIFLSALLLFASCNDKQKVDEKSVTDDLGFKFEFAESPKNVISLAPSITESMYFLGLQESLAGVTQYCDYPEDAKKKKSVGGMLDPNLEVISKINPDLIFLTTEGNSQMTYKSLKDLGFKVFVLNPKNVEGIVSSLDKLNSIFRNPESENRLNKFKSELDSISKPGETANIKPYAALLALKPLITFSKNTFLNDVFAKSGYKNVYGDENLDYPAIAEEDLFAKDPQYVFIFAPVEKEESVRKEFESKFGTLSAAQNKTYKVLDENVFTRPGPRVLNSIKQLKGEK